MQMNVSLPPAMYKLVHDKVDSGMYSNASEVVRDALRVFEQKQRDAKSWEQLGVLLNSAEESGRSKLSISEIVDNVVQKKSK